jgi:hypothetical protein
VANPHDKIRTPATNANGAGKLRAQCCHLHGLVNKRRTQAQSSSLKGQALVTPACLNPVGNVIAL